MNIFQVYLKGKPGDEKTYFGGCWGLGWVCYVKKNNETTNLIENCKNKF